LADPRLSVVVLAYNEASNLRPAVGELLEELRRLGSPFELVLVDDGSSDGTGPLADEIARAEPGVRVVHHGANRGLGGGYRTGFQEARGELVTFFPADRQYAADIIGAFLARIGDADAVLGYLPRRGDSAAGRILSAAERAVYRILLGPMPRFGGILMLRRRMIDELPLETTGRGWGVLMELLVRASRAGYKMVSVPIEVRPRLSGASKVQNVRTIASNLKQVWDLRRLLSRGP
jgi:glycosyltransferase involved in cell wall biosynthesis